MKRLFTITAVFGCLFTIAQAQKPNGVWEGEVQDPKRPLVLNLDFDTLTGSISGNTSVKADHVTAENRAITFDVIAAKHSNSREDPALKFAIDLISSEQPHEDQTLATSSRDY